MNNETCPICEGTKLSGNTEHQCQWCDGTGHTTEEKIYDFMYRVEK